MFLLTIITQLWFKECGRLSLTSLFFLPFVNERHQNLFFTLPESNTNPVFVPHQQHLSSELHNTVSPHEAIKFPGLEMDNSFNNPL